MGCPTDCKQVAMQPEKFLAQKKHHQDFQARLCGKATEQD